MGGIIHQGTPSSLIAYKAQLNVHFLFHLLILRDLAFSFCERRKHNSTIMESLPEDILLVIIKKIAAFGTQDLLRFERTST